MLVYEFKAYGTAQQLKLVNEAIRTVQFVRNKCLRLWIDGGAKNGYDLNKYSSRQICQDKMDGCLEQFGQS